MWPRSAKSIPLSAEARAALGIEADVPSLSPKELMNAILKAPVDLLWNGGIGTYVKSSRENNADVGDRANNGLRVDGNQLRCKVVGEGGNLGLTQLGRIEAAQHGVLLNTDFIDNSAGVDTSDHEVNIKILLNGEVQKKKLTAAGAQQAARIDDRRGRRPGAQRQLPPEPGDQPDGADEPVAAGLQAALHPHPGIAGPAGPSDRIPARPMPRSPSARRAAWA